MGYTLEQLYNQTPRAKPLPERLLCLDPGETTGVAFFQGLSLIFFGQSNTSDMTLAPKVMAELFDRFAPTECVCEDYRIYQWRQAQHTWAALHTPRLIGCVETICVQRDIPLRKRMAQHAKGFMTDDRLKAFDMYASGMRHARDAIRHGCYEILFGRG